MLRATAISFALITLIIATPSSATEPAGDLEHGWRWEYENQLVALIALADFDAVATKLAVTLDRLEAKGKLNSTGMHEIRGLFECLEEEYMDKWFGDGGRFASNSVSNQSVNNNYDREFREQTRSKTPTEKPTPPTQNHDRVLSKEKTGQDHDIVWTVEMAAKNQQWVDIGDERNGIIVALIDLVNEQAGTKAVAPGRHSLKLTIDPGTRNGVAVWWYSLEVSGQSNKWHHSGEFTREMLNKISEMKKADAAMESLNAELAQIYDDAGIAHYSPLERMGYHKKHDCHEYGCNMWGEGQRFPPQSMRVTFEYPEVSGK